MYHLLFISRIEKDIRFFSNLYTYNLRNVMFYLLWDSISSFVKWETNFQLVNCIIHKKHLVKCFKKDFLLFIVTLSFSIYVFGFDFWSVRISFPFLLWRKPSGSSWFTFSPSEDVILTKKLSIRAHGGCRLCFLFCFWPHHAACGILVPRSGTEPSPLHGNHRVLITGPLGKSLLIVLTLRFTHPRT